MPKGVPGRALKRRCKTPHRRPTLPPAPTPAAPPRPQPRPALVLLPEASLHPGFFQEDPGALRQISCKRGFLAVVKADGTAVLWEKVGRDESHGPARKPSEYPVGNAACPGWGGISCTESASLACRGPSTM